MMTAIAAATTMHQQVLFSRRIVLADRCISGEVVVRGGFIAEVVETADPSGTAVDLGDDLLIPGLVDIHTDNLEKHYQPRPGANWDDLGAVIAHDGQCAAAGITTVLDSLALHGERNGLDRAAAFPKLVAAIDQCTRDGLLRIDHGLHLRFEVTKSAILDIAAPYLDHPRLRLLSLMDHRPGQRQLHLKSPSDQAVDDTEIADLCRRNRRHLADICHAQGVALAGHDDATLEHIAEAVSLGCTMAEFPVTQVAAQAARHAGMTIAMGAPNLVRGGSHSGNLSAKAAAQAGLLDILASDYIPLSMIRAAFLLAEADQGFSLPDAIATVTDNPARATGLTDRGRIAPGLRADLVQVRWQPGRWPLALSVWLAGNRVA
jgi:alpha-D-ribose 1-methylphosphonate 5-triphosphate diphosphatase